MRFTSKAKKQAERLPEDISDALVLLRRELEREGPVRHNWPHYGKLKGKKDLYHRHLNKGKPRYVAVWKVADGEVRFMEIRYVGTHEKADYGRMD